MDNVKNRNAWLVVKSGNSAGNSQVYSLQLTGERSKFQAVQEADWVLVLNGSSEAIAVGRVYRVRSVLESTTLYFDKYFSFEAPASLVKANIPAPGAQISRLQWTDFAEGLPKLSGVTLADIPLVDDQAYIRELLQLAVMDDLLGPANGPYEEIIDMSVRDRYLVGKLAPRDSNKNDCIESLNGPLANQEEETPDEIIGASDKNAPNRLSHEPGAEFNSTTGKVEPEADSADEIDAASNQSLIPSSMGITFCVSGDVDAIEVEASWGRYERFYDHEHTKPIKRKMSANEIEAYKNRQGLDSVASVALGSKNAAGEEMFSVESEAKTKVWKRIPCGGPIVLPMTEGIIPHQAPDKAHSGVRIQGSIRAKNANGDRLITLFLVNAQEEPETNKDSAWLFQPEIKIRAPKDAKDKAIFRRRPLALGDSDDEERKSLEMVYRKKVEFAVGHGAAVHAISDRQNVEQATEIRTVIMPQYEVPVTETPGLNPDDRKAMQEMIEKGYLDMQNLAEMERDELVSALTMLADDYGVWIGEQRKRIGKDVEGYDQEAKDALTKCEDIQRRLEEGIKVLAEDDHALKAFRTANLAMANQRIRSMYALSQRRKQDKTLADFQVRKNRSWRPFQLAFVLLSIPSLANPQHKDRTKPIEAYADLLWFPTGGGKTEAYLGVAAFTMFIRRLQGNLGGYDSTRGLSVVMRYTLRLLTLQQFQRATTLICAMEVLRRDALANGDESLGKEPFTIGLWVGNKVTPGTTEDSHKAIQDIRNPDKWDAGSSSPAQLTSCPWCGGEVAPGRDIEVNRLAGQTTIYCGDKKSHCDFSRGKSSSQPHPGIPVMVVDEEIYHRPPTMMIATVDKFAMMAWRGQVRTLFGRANRECPRHGLLWPDSDCEGNHRAAKGLPATKVRSILPIRPPDLIIQDEFHLISGPLGTMVGLYETAVDELATWDLEGSKVKPKIIASTATVRKAPEQVNGVFMRKVSVFPPHGLDIEDNFFSVQRPIEEKPGRRYLGVCSPGSSRPAMLIRVYTAFLTASQGLFERFGSAADPYLTTVGYFNSLRELGGMKRLAEDDVQTRSYRVQMSLVDRPGLAQRSVQNIRELTSRVSNQDIPKYLDQLEVPFKADFDSSKGKFVTNWQEGDSRAIDVVLATNMLSVGVDVNRLGLMAVNGQPKGTAEYIQATSRVGRQFPGLVCTVLTWARPRDLSHYETFEHYHATFYKHVEAQSVTPFSPRAMDRGLTGAMISIMRLENDALNPNPGAMAMSKADCTEAKSSTDIITNRAWCVTDRSDIQALAKSELKSRLDEWSKKAGVGGRILGYEKRGPNKDTMAALIQSPGIKAWDDFTVPMSMREVEPGVRLVMNTRKIADAPKWNPRPISDDEDSDQSSSDDTKKKSQVSSAQNVPLADIVGGKYKQGEIIDIEIDGHPKKLIVSNSNVQKPKKNSFTVLSIAGVQQGKFPKGVLAGKLSWSELQDENGKSLVRVKLRYPGANSSFDLTPDEWSSVTVHAQEA
ncbi:DISARM system helicase DrmA [Halioxenophilus sp. WMMB6]|uniref:DISARM system helicase DrmA n=1 Tax=Halioxenophilus sp. WMMB6 TaxID=3073815 RepID=UPI00295F426B|nr:DISARM system helicase DrmA [Halioxenophilus sp. WMMB6]